MSRLQLGVLGPLEVTLDGRAVDVGGRLPRMLLAMLVATHGRVMPVDRIIEDLWASEPPPTAVATLQGYVSRLRSRLEPERRTRTADGVLARQGAGYVLRIAPDQIDAERFTLLTQRGARLLHEGLPEDAVRMLDEALALWRGPAYADCPDASFATGEIARLGNLRTAAREDRAEAALQARQPLRAITDLELLVADQPLRERAWELLALAHYRVSGQAEALAAIRAAREHLAEELGIDPGPKLRKLEADVLRQAPELDLAPLTWREHPAGAPQAEWVTRNLPEPVSAFVGRAAEIVTLTDLLAKHRLVTLVGSGGAGKTRLAIELARRRPDLDGPWFVQLADLADPAELHLVVADALDIADPVSAEALADLLRYRRTLLVLNNCEHLVDAVAQLVDTVLGRAPHLRVLATSREPLGVPGEVVVDVLPLPAEGVDSDAVTLFRDRAAGVLPSWHPTDAELEVVERICHELDGMPLAIELAAANVRLLSVEELASRLQDRFAVLRSTSRIGPERHRSLEAAVASSYDSLTPADQSFFCRLSIFDGGFDVEGAQRVIGDDAALSRLGRLVTKSLVMVESKDRARRLRLLMSLRQYGAQRLTTKEQKALARCHREWVRDLVETGAPRLRSADAPGWLLRMERELPNIRAAFSSALASDDAETALRIAAATYWFCYRRGHSMEGLRWLDLSLAQATDAPTSLRAEACVGRAALCYLSGWMPEAGKAIADARTLAIEAGDPELESLSAIYGAYFMASTGDLAGAQESAGHGLTLAKKIEQPWLVAEALMIMGQVSRASGDLQAAERVLAEAIAIGTDCGHWWAAGSAAWIAAKVAVDLGENERALEILLDVARESEDQSDITSWLVVLQALAGALAMNGDAATGALLLGAVEAIGGRVGFSPDQMDPVDTRRNSDAVRQALSPAELGANLERGRAMTEAQVMSLVRQLG